MTDPMGAYRSRRPRVLLVEDDLPVREVVTIILTEEGYHVDAATRPAQAIEALRRDTFDVVLTDLFSWNLRAGLATVRRLVEAAAPVPVGAFTSHRLSAEEARAAGFAFVVPKPFEMDDLLIKLSRATTGRARGQTERITARKRRRPTRFSA
jgi:CheY-like chemotaxis protein